MNFFGTRGLGVFLLAGVGLAVLMYGWQFVPPLLYIAVGWAVLLGALNSAS